jgi:hypothetical protein
MKAAQLFVTSKSLVGMKDHNSPYKMCTTNLVPNFGAKKNPFAAVSEVPALELPPWGAAPAKPKVQPQVASTQSLQLFDEDMKPAVQIFSQPTLPVAGVEVFQVNKPAAPAVCETRAILMRGHSAEVVLPKPLPKVRQERSIGGGLISQIFAWGKVGRNSQKAVQKPVQVELALSRITVKRNSLHEADLRVVSRAASVSPAVSAASCRAGVEGAKETGGGFSGALLKFFAFGQIRAR